MCRDWLLGNITQTPIPTGELKNGSTYSGKTSFGGYTYYTGIKYVSGLLQNNSNGVNHALTVEENGLPAIDGLVAVLDVQIISGPSVLCVLELIVSSS